MGQIFNRIKELVKSNIPVAKNSSADILEEEIHQLKNRLGMDEYGLKPQKYKNIQPKSASDKIKYSNNYNDYLKEGIGKEGEKATLDMLTNNILGKKIVWNNMIITTGSGSSEIDLFLIMPKGIFVIENKNYHGTVYGYEHSMDWKYYLNSKEYIFYNPIMQNAGHIKYLKELLQTRFQVECNYYNIVIFNKQCKPKVTYTSDKTFVGNVNDAIKYINSVPNEAAISDDKMDRVRNYLVYYHGMDITKRKQHISYVNKTITKK